MRPLCALAVAIALSLPALPALAADGLVSGKYRCSAGAAGKLTLVIRDASTYADRNGKTGRYTFDASKNAIVFETGPWAGQFGKRLKDRKIGVSSRPGGSSNVICDLE